MEFLTNICLNFVNNIHLVFRYSEFSNARPAEYTTDAEKQILVVLAMFGHLAKNIAVGQ